jgi:hypothetical protein
LRLPQAADGAKPFCVPQNTFFELFFLKILISPAAAEQSHFLFVNLAAKCFAKLNFC